MLCGDGTALAITLDEAGHEAGRTRSVKFFDATQDPLTEKGVRSSSRWHFASFEGFVYGIDFAAEAPAAAEPWSLFSDAERSAGWRIGGIQHLALHQRSGRLYALMHQGGRDTHKEPGEAVWVYDVGTHRRLKSITLRNPGVTIYGFPLDVGRTWPSPFNHLSPWLLDTFAPAAVGFIQVTQDEAPLLLTASQFFGSIGVYEAYSGRFLRRVQPTGWTSDILLAPWGGQGPSTQLGTGPSTQLRTGPSTQLRTGPSTQLGTGPAPQLGTGGR
jgi:methylamine dehydrogenase heavy chain